MSRSISISGSLSLSPPLINPPPPRPRPPSPRPPVPHPPDPRPPVPRSPVPLRLSLQAIFDRNRKDELPALQLEWIDGICKPLYQVTDSPVLNPSSLFVTDTPS